MTGLSTRSWVTEYDIVVGFAVAAAYSAENP
jgi:hypothetical protein